MCLKERKRGVGLISHTERPYSLILGSLGRFHVQVGTYPLPEFKSPINPLSCLYFLCGRNMLDPIQLARARFSPHPLSKGLKTLRKNPMSYSTTWFLCAS